ncbi:Protein-lysine N-methyltransferase rrg1 [Yamadazyma tenuis]|uniref:S-adenosyl-L-methionine-dependent methyltransferase n=1 Tax=Candida tenuis (strain ATCC 10573 / BCRC 21748 / CBS 615 / JCM 9827 / NBRC 10315 / NRRL Y-1498 / VKM Y-70) TaxID=590646 RepID=G3B5K2_CANTC|nr:uncharacterized protein CANTEDRAFT_123234 [Yamadazyma tenuis ATCC 10573]EGV63251.1 hypothetical protein CANTEDRAFT_123234 [Yamadazyma tenuis ATCC 10573]WEJ96934.1 Protein-lysine N-methyltransferase rrg1 [Yamadazyma tenuis]
MSFDPLSLFTPKQVDQVEPEVTVQHPHDDIFVQVSPDMAEEAEDYLIPIHILDLPMLKMKPPAHVLLLFLKLLAADEVWNFKQHQQNPRDSMALFQEKSVSLDLVHSSLAWLSSHSTRFNTMVKVGYLPMLSINLKKTNEYNDWLTRIISSDLKWLQKEEIDEIQKEASLRISENCGRTAQPDIIRKIKLDNMNQIQRDYLKLKEPSLTSDNLGLKTWGSSLILSQKLLNERSLLQEPILELGAGTGLVGIVCLLLGFKKVFLTDLEEILPNLKHNLLINQVDTEVEELDWNDPTGFLVKHSQINFKTIILSDPIYSSDHPALIHKVLKKFTGPQTHVLIQVPLRRNYEDVRETLWNLLDQSFTPIETSIELGADEFGDVEYCFKRLVLK